jgi:hypothetical protein
MSTDCNVQSALLAGVLTSTGSWPTILPNGMESPWPVRTSWYCGIILSLLSIISAADQTVRLHRLSSHRDGLANIRRLLSKGSRSERTGRRAPSVLQIMTWQMPVMFLVTATICMVVGMFLLVWSATAHLGTPALWDDQTKVCLPHNGYLECCVLTREIGGGYIHCRCSCCHRHVFCGTGVPLFSYQVTGGSSVSVHKFCRYSPSW